MKDLNVARKKLEEHKTAVDVARKNIQETIQIIKDKGDWGCVGLHAFTTFDFEELGRLGLELWEVIKKYKCTIFNYGFDLLSTAADAAFAAAATAGSAGTYAAYIAAQQMNPTASGSRASSTAKLLDLGAEP